MLDIRDLSVTYPGGVCALDRLSLSIAPGLTGLLGPNGAGKSTLLRTLASLQEPDQGDLVWRLDDGRELRRGRDDDAWRARLGYLPQDFGLFPTLTVEETVDHFAALKGWHRTSERRTIVAEQLAAVHLERHARSMTGSLSGGMRQRVGLAIALLGSPALLVIDEPTTGLDPDERAALLLLLAAQAARSIVLLSTHLVEDVAALCERVVMLDHGRVVLDDTPTAAVARLQDRVWRLALTPSEMAQWRHHPTLLREGLVAGRVELRVWSESAPSADWHPVAPTLEDAYAAVRLRGSPTAPKRR